MAWRLYIVPKVGTGLKPNLFRPKYLVDDITPSPWSGMDHGFAEWYVVAADLSPTDDAFVVSQPDAFALPVTLDATLTAGQVTAVQTKLEAINIPSQWVSTVLTWRQVVRVVLGIISLAQRFMGLTGRTNLLGGAVTLDSTMGSLSAGVRTSLQVTAESFGLDTSSLISSTTIRQALQTLGQQLTGRSFALGGLTI